MNIFLTFDYEIFFGEKSGNVDQCMIEPTEELLHLAEKYKIHYTFFWDIGHYLALKKWSVFYPTLLVDVQKIEKQLKNVVILGHALELHIHPHWEKAEYTERGWKMNLEQHYKLSDFPEDERIEIFGRYKTALDDFKGSSGKAFRAGGWCIQPFSHFAHLFRDHQIVYDSSTMPGVKWQTEQYQLDFRLLKTDEPFRFSSNECIEDKAGEFMEYPISTAFYSPFFFWKLYVLGRLFPSRHKMWGNGTFVAQPGGKKEMLLKGKYHHASVDGFFASKLNTILRKKISRKESTMVVIGHPKSLTRFSVQQMDKFISSSVKQHTFLTFQDLL